MSEDPVVVATLLGVVIPDVRPIAFRMNARVVLLPVVGATAVFHRVWVALWTFEHHLERKVAKYKEF